MRKTFLAVAAVAIVAAIAVSVASGAASTRRIAVLDDCDTASFDAVLGLTPVPECAIPGLFIATEIAPDGTLVSGPLAAGTHRFMCLIHPWMRTTVEVG